MDFQETKLRGSGVREMMAAAALIPNALHLEIGQPDWHPPENVCEAGARALFDGVGYTPSLGVLPLREKVAERTAGRTGIDVSPDMVAVTPGAVCAVATVILLRSGPGRPLLIPDAAWPNYALMPGLSGAELLRYPLEGHAPDLSALAALDIDEALLVVNTPGNPTGRLVDRAYLAQLLALAKSRKWFVLVDEVYEDLVWGGEFVHAVSVAGSFTDLAIISGVSKSFGMTGYRVGWFVSEPKLVKDAEAVLESLVSCPASSSQEASLAALDLPPEYLQVVQRNLKDRAEAVTDACNQHDVAVAPLEAGLYAWVCLGESIADGRAFALDLLEAERIAVAPGSAFGHGGMGHVRIALVQEPAVLRDSMERMLHFWRTYQ